MIVGTYKEIVMDSGKREEPGVIRDEKIKDENLTEELLEWKEWAESWLNEVEDNKKDNE